MLRLSAALNNCPILSPSPTIDNVEHITDLNIPHPSVEQVQSWDHVETARQLQGLGVEVKHCEIFENQEITGEVLLDMDNTFVFMERFDFGVMGRHLKTWHKIETFQKEVKQHQQSTKSKLLSFIPYSKH